MTSLADFLMRNRLDALEEKPEYTTADVNSLMPKPSWESPLAGLGSYQLSQESGAKPNWFGRNVLSNIPPEAMHAANFLAGRLPKGFRIERSGSRDDPNLSYSVKNAQGNEVGDAVVRNAERLGMENVYLEAPYRRQGIGTALYGHIEQDLGKKFAPSGMLTDQGHAFWMKLNPEAVRGYARLNPHDHFAWRRAEPETPSLVSVLKVRE